MSLVGTESVAETVSPSEIATTGRARVRPPLSSEISKQKFSLCLALFAATVLFFSPVVRDGFVLLDDVPYILGNPQVRSGISWQTIKWSFTTFHAGYWHPLTWISHALDCQLFGVNPAGHHLVSLLIHAANAVLLFLLLEEATTLLWPSWLVAAVFAFHPVNVESVAWAAERKNVLSMLFFLLALWAYGRYASKGGARRYSLVAGWFALGLMAKPQIITLPCVLLLWDYWPLNRLFPRLHKDGHSPAPRSLGFLIVEKIPLLLIAAAGSVITVLGQRSADAVRSVAEYTLSVRVENAIYSYARYLANFFWPVHLTPLYPHPENTLHWWQVAGATFLLIAISTAVVSWRERRYLAIGWLWFLGVLVPMIGIVQVGDQAMADRFEYIPMIGIAIALVWSVDELLPASIRVRKWAGVLAFSILAIFGVLTYRQSKLWKDGITLFRHTLSITRNHNDYLAHQALGMALDNAGRVQEAIPEFEAAESMRAFPAPQVLNLGIYEQRNGHLSGAMRLFKKVTQISPDPTVQSNAWMQLGSAQVQSKNYTDAAASYENALRILPDNSPALLGTALLAERNGNMEQAVSLLRRSVKSDPNLVTVLLLARALRRDHQFQESKIVEDKARTISAELAQGQDSANRIEAQFGISPL